MITITREFRISWRQVETRFVVSNGENTQYVFAGTLDYHDGLNMLTGNAINDRYSDTNWANDKTFGKPSVYNNIEEFLADEWTSKYEKRLLEAIESL